MAQINARLRINLESGKEKETKINLPSYEMYQTELLDRMLLSIQHTEEAFIDVNNRIITNVNARKDRLNMVNARIQHISSKILALYNQKKLMRITSPATLPKISTSEVPSNHPHQTVFYDRCEIIDLATEIDEGAQPAPVTSNMPELSSLQLQNKLYNTRIKNKPEDLQQVISGATKHIHDITKLLLSLSKYRAETMGAVNTHVSQYISTNRASMAQNAAQAADASQEGVLGFRPTNITSVAELMLADTNTNVYEDNKVNYIQESGAVFNIRGRKQKVLSKKEKEVIEQQKQLAIKKKAIQKSEQKKREIAPAPISFGQDKSQKPMAMTNPFFYTGAESQIKDIDLKDNLRDSDESSDGDDDMGQFFATKKAADEKKKMDMTQALFNKRNEHENTMMDPGASRMDYSVQIDTRGPPQAEDGETDQPPVEPEVDPETGELIEQPAEAPVELVKPEYDANAMEDMAPAERARLNLAIYKREQEERQRLIDEMIAAEKEADPDALDEDIRTKVNKKINLKKSNDLDGNTTIVKESKKNKQPAIELRTVMAANIQQKLEASDTTWKDQQFISRQKTTRPGGPPRGPPPSGGRPGAPPKGPPPSSSRKSTSKAPAASSAKAPAAAVNSNIPKAPPVGHFIAFIKGNYDPANPPSDSGAAATAPPIDDLMFNPSDALGGNMGQNEQDDLAGMIDAIGGDGLSIDPSPAAKQDSGAASSGAGTSLDAEPGTDAFDPKKPHKPLEEMSMDEQLQWNARVMRHKKILKEKNPEAFAPKKPAYVDAEPGTDAFDPNSPPMPLDQMAMHDQLQWQMKVNRHKKILKERKAAGVDAAAASSAPVADAEPGTDAFDPNKPPVPLDQMSMPDQLQWNTKVMRHKKMMKERKAAESAAGETPAQSQAPAESKPDATATSGEAEPGTDAFDPNKPPMPLDQMAIPEQLAWSQKVMRHKKILKEKAAQATQAAQEGGPPAATTATSSADAEPGTDAFDPNKPPMPLDQMSMPEQIQWNQKVMRHKAELKKAAAAKKAEEEAKTAMPEPEPTAADEGDNSSRKSSDSFGTDASMIDESRVEESKGQEETGRMTVIPEEDESSRMSEVPSQVVVKPPVIKSTPAPQQPRLQPSKTVTSASKIQTASRRVSNIDVLKAQLAVRQATMHGSRGKAAQRRKDDSSDDNESSSDEDD